MNSLDAAERVNLGKRYIIAAWVVSGLQHLITQHESIHSARTAEEIGGDTAVRLCRLREDYRQSRLAVPLISAMGQVCPEELRALGLGDDFLEPPPRLSDVKFDCPPPSDGPDGKMRFRGWRIRLSSFVLL
ncbi:uncharacterized protein LACBIDRAFT_327752 [Laccaria bicolor S238N-H82]|uniref:Predicted protein n=1 Tax=Laccaria bicolor (strain S238N-H82 / ATCC MYA-4686) TaxID=486041 RepID=B0DCQ7_LACBS|nr:uncharacterized protein LACBIDRAFT_327752 [Laccaria bicolor S238N-H82]EDR07774.1 predicted protein [Laccaria bicolor S238N-H82]|eukprot:XP_001881563.1 predicted protein [Laccaria bicolor S238N-H82]